MKPGDLVKWMPPIDGSTVARMYMFTARGDDAWALGGEEIFVSKNTVAIVLKVIGASSSSLNYKKLEVVASNGLVGWAWDDWVVKV